jgi:hypothetical protein
MPLRALAKALGVPLDVLVE